MSKRNISYIKPQDPSFLAKLKAEIGYKEGPTVDTKRQKLHLEDGESDSGEECVERPEREDEQPQVVVLGAGDLTAEQAEAEKRRIAKEEAEAPADLNQRIIFKKKSKVLDKEGSTSEKGHKEKKEAKKPKKSNSNKLSFNEEDEEEEDDL